MPTVLTKNIQVAEKLEDRLLTNMAEVEKEIFELVDRLMRQFDIENGKFVSNAKSSQLLTTLNKEIAKILKRAGIKDEVMNFIDDFDEIDRNIKQIQQAVNGIRVPVEIFSQQKKWAIDATVNSLLQANIDVRLSGPIKQLLYSRVSFGGSAVQAEKQLRQMIIGSPEKLGSFQQWVGQIARDTVNQYQGTVNQQIKVQYELTNIRYVGPLVKDSRPQCIRWIEKFDGFLTDAQLAGEIEWAYKNGSGMMPDTFPQNFCQKRGGYNCIHTAIPVRKK